MYKIRPHFNLEDFPVNFIKQFVIKIRIVLLFTFHQGYCTSHQLIFYTDKVLMMGRSGNSCVFNFAIVLKNCENY